LLKHQVKGAVNLCSSHPITQQEFAQSLGKYCKKRVLLKIPRWLVRLLFGQMSSLFLFSTSAQPKKLLELGAVFSYPNFKNTLHHQIQP
jgi:NAD dependent epimerase/dehydratase family enzyme